MMAHAQQPLACPPTDRFSCGQQRCRRSDDRSPLRTLVAQKGQVLHDAVVVIDGDRITKVGSAEIAIPAGANVIDLRRYTSIPA